MQRGEDTGRLPSQQTITIEITIVAAAMQ